MYKYNKKLKERARQMRREMTRQEGLLWHKYLKRYQIKFIRQRVIDNYIADFYCSKAKLIIELDGSQHYDEDQIEYDTIRTKTLNAMGIEVIRFANNEVEYNFDSVCILIDKKVKDRLKN